MSFKRFLKNVTFGIFLWGIVLYFGGLRFTSLAVARRSLPINSSLIHQAKFNSFSSFTFEKDSYYLTSLCKRSGLMWKHLFNSYNYNYYDDLVKTITLIHYDDDIIFIVKNDDENVDSIQIKQLKGTIAEEIGVGEVLHFLLDGSSGNSYRTINADALSKDGNVLYKWEVRNISKFKNTLEEECRWYYN